MTSHGLAQSAGCQRLLQWLQQAGMQVILVCPGNRNLPLIAAASRTDDLELLSFPDERAAAFIALGRAAASGRPVAVCTTSGSAVANCLPALCEAHAARLPLVLLSADRPARLQGCEAPQTMPQADIFRPFCSASIALADGLDRAALDAACMQISAALRAGPVHINLPLDEPLLAPPPTHPPPPLPTADGPSTHADAELPAAVQALLRPGLRGLLVVGPRCPLTADQVHELAMATGFPLLADASSGLRRPAMAGLITTAGRLCSTGTAPSGCDLLIRLGPAPVQRPVYEWIADHDGPVLRIDQEAIPVDFCHAAFTSLIAPGPSQLAALADGLKRAPATWTAAWQQVERQAAAHIDGILAAGPWNEVQAVQTVLQSAPPGPLQASNSLPVRLLDLLARPAEVGPRLVANRGVNGIDGQIASFLGRCSQHPQQRGVLLCGDLAALYDATALQWATSQGLAADICLLDNGGGRIFDLLPVADDPQLAAIVRGHSPVDWAQLTPGFGCAYQACRSQEQLRTALARPPDGPRLLHCLDFQAETVPMLRELLRG